MGKPAFLGFKIDESITSQYINCDGYWDGVGIDILTSTHD